MKNLRDFSNYINESEDSNYAPVTIKKFNEFVNGIEEDAVKAGEDSDVVIDDITLDSGEEIKGAEILGVIIDSETEKEFKDYFYNEYGNGAFTEADIMTLVKFYNEYQEEKNAEKAEKEKEEEDAAAADSGTEEVPAEEPASDDDEDLAAQLADLES
jgi:pyruvate/2-oxoglutarate dehydrogenase complex dihydrolipoamide acyltransferase (E2) component